MAALVAFLLVERRSANPMMPLDIFASRQFSAANLVTFVVYAALGGFFFLFVAFLQISLGYSPIAAGAASLPVTVLMLLFSARSGALAQRIGARIPLTVGPLVIAVGLLMMTGIDPGDSYVTSVLPAVIVFGAGLTLVVSPVTATVLAAADSRHSGIASGINNAVARVAGLLAVAVLPLIAGLTGDKFYDPVAMTDGFRIAMVACAGLAAAGRDPGLADDQLGRPGGRTRGSGRGADRLLVRGRGHAVTAGARGRRQQVMSPPRPNVHVVGRRLDPEHHRLRDMLTRAAQPFEWHEAGSPEADELLARHGANDAALPGPRRRRRRPGRRHGRAAAEIWNPGPRRRARTTTS